MVRVAIVGVGALGCVASRLMLDKNFNVVLIDRDVVDQENLERQPLYCEQDIGKPKALAATNRLKTLYPKEEILGIARDLDMDGVSMLEGCAIILDCTDNMETRFLINDFCLRNKIPWVHSAAIRDVGNVISFSPGKPCFSCIFSNAAQLETCNTAGVDISIVNAVAQAQVDAAVSLLEGYSKQVLIRFNGSGRKVYTIKKRKSCKACLGIFEYLEGIEGSKAVRLCGKGIYQIRGGKIDLGLLKSRLNAFDDFGSCIRAGDVTLFDDGRALIKAQNEAVARAKYFGLVG